MVQRCAGCVDVSITPLKCERHGRNNDLPTNQPTNQQSRKSAIRDNPTGQNPDLKAKITSKIESKNVFAFPEAFSIQSVVGDKSRKKRRDPDGGGERKRHCRDGKQGKWAI